MLSTKTETTYIMNAKINKLATNIKLEKVINKLYNVYTHKH